MDDSTHYGCTALWMVAFHKPPHALRCIDILLSKGANLNATSKESTTPLAMAAMKGAWGGQHSAPRQLELLPAGVCCMSCLSGPCLCKHLG